MLQPVTDPVTSGGIGSFIALPAVTAIMRRNGQVVLGDTGGITFQFIAVDINGNELGATEQIKVESVSTETVTEVQATFVKKYDYKFENNVLQIYKAPYTFTDGTVRIGG